MSVRKRSWTTSKGEARTAWIVDYFDAEGTRRQKTFAKQADAKAWRDRTGVELQQGTHVPDRASCTVSDAGKLWLETCEANKLERSTTDAYRNHLDLHIKPFIGETLISRLNVPAVRAFEDKLRTDGRSEAMVKRVVSSLGAIIADAQEQGLAAHNAVREMRIGRKGRQKRREERHRERLEVGRDIPTPSEVKAFLGFLSGGSRPLLMTAAFCGLRASELRGLRWQDVDLKKRELTVTQRADRYNEIGSPKSKQSRRTVPIPKGLTAILMEWKLACPKSELGLVFPNGAGQIESHANIINRGLVPAMIGAGVTVDTGRKDDNGKPIRAAKYTGMHALRHFYASWCINPVASGGMGLSPKEVQERMGHASIVMTMDRYGHLFPKGDAASEVDAAERGIVGVTMSIIELDWTAFISLVASAGILSAVVSWGLGAFVAARAKSQRANFLLLQLSMLFQEYAAERMRAYVLHYTLVNSRGAAGQRIDHLPGLPSLPEMPDVWPLIDTKIADRALSFGSRVSQNNTSLLDYFDVVGDVEENEIVLSHVKLGFEALILSRDLRYSAGLPATEIGEKLAKEYPEVIEDVRSKIEHGAQWRPQPA